MRGLRVDWTAVGALWWREMRRFLRARSRLVATLVVPILLFAYFALGLNRLMVGGSLSAVPYPAFLLPGIIGMSVLLSATVAGISVLWDREFGFLKEVLVAPVSRLSIILGRIAGGVTTSFLQVVIILAAGAAAGIRPVSAVMFAAGLVLVVLGSVGFVGLGLAFSSLLHDTQGFNMVMGFVVFPVLLLSGALFPLDASPAALRVLSALDPLTYVVDGLRACLLGISDDSLALDFGVAAAFAGVTVMAGTILFRRMTDR